VPEGPEAHPEWSKGKPLSAKKRHAHLHIGAIVPKPGWAGGSKMGDMSRYAP